MTTKQTYKGYLENVTLCISSDCVEVEFGYVGFWGEGESRKKPLGEESPGSIALVRRWLLLSVRQLFSPHIPHGACEILSVD